VDIGGVAAGVAGGVAAVGGMTIAPICPAPAVAVAVAAGAAALGLWLAAELATWWGWLSRVGASQLAPKTSSNAPSSALAWSGHRAWAALPRPCET
jgi:hypothetical protein